MPRICSRWAPSCCQRFYFAGLQIHGARVHGVQTRGTRIRGAQIRGTQIRGIQISRIQIGGIQIRGKGQVPRASLPLLKIIGRPVRRPASRGLGTTMRRGVRTWIPIAHLGSRPKAPTPSTPIPGRTVSPEQGRQIRGQETRGRRILGGLGSGLRRCPWRSDCAADGRSMLPST